jgi:hypothetical protein
MANSTASSINMYFPAQITINYKFFWLNYFLILYSNF